MRIVHQLVNFVKYLKAVTAFEVLSKYFRTFQRLLFTSAHKYVLKNCEYHRSKTLTKSPDYSLTVPPQTA